MDFLLKVVEKATICWELVSRGKENGGLGTENIREEIYSNFSQVALETSYTKDSIKHVVMKSKYVLHPNRWDPDEVKIESCRSIWSAIYKE